MGKANITQTVLYILIFLLAVAQTAMHIATRHWDTDGYFGHEKIGRTWASRIGWSIVGILIGLYTLAHLAIKSFRSTSRFVSALFDVCFLSFFLALEILAVVIDGLSVFSTADIVTCLCGVVILGTLVFEIMYVATRKAVAGRWSSSIKELSSGW